MAVAIIATDSWINHLQFTGAQRQTNFGPIDGLFYGVISGTGDATGGNFTLNANISFDRKEDWIYVLQKVSASKNGVFTEDVFVVAATGPLIPTDTAVANPSFHVGGVTQGIVNNAVTTVALASGGGALGFEGLPVFGDKRIAGPLSMIAAGFELNSDGNVYQMSVYGWLIRYSGFFRGVAPSVG